jgi:FkbM family methyltransferase
MSKQHVKVPRLQKISRLFQVIGEKGIVEGVKTVGRFIAHNWDRCKENLLLFYLKLRSKNGLIVSEIQESKMYLDTSDPGISRELILRGVHEELATKFLRQELKKGMVVIDIGANLGYYALLEASIVEKEGQVYAFEPVHKNFDILTKNIKVNGYKNVKAYCKAVSSKSGTSKIALTDASNWGSMLDISDETVSGYMKQKMHKLTQQVIRVDTVSLDEFLDKEGVNQVNLIRMDIEGYEVQVIKGMTNTLRNTSSLKLFFEIHNKVFNDPKTTIGFLLEQLLTFGFEPKAIILPDSILYDISKVKFIQTVCSYRSMCPHVLLEK